MRKQINRRLQPPLLVARSSGIAFVNRWAVTTASQSGALVSELLFFSFLFFIFPDFRLSRFFVFGKHVWEIWW